MVRNTAHGGRSHLALPARLQGISDTARAHHGRPKRRDGKVAQLEAGFYGEEHDWRTPPAKLGTPKLFNLITDPQEEYPQASIENSWVAAPTMRIAAQFMESLRRYPPIEPGTPDPYSPPK